MGKVFNVGIIGYGRSGRNIHATQIGKMPRKFKVAAVADPLPSRREMAAEEFGCDTYADWRKMLKRDDLDLVVNAGPSHKHAAWSLECLSKGFNVLCEKPVCRKLKELEALFKEADKRGVLFAVFQNNRYDPVFQKIKQIIDSGVIGKVVMIKGRRDNFARRWDWQTLRRYYGGNLMNTGVHLLDQMIHLIGTEVKPSVTCRMNRVLTYGDAEDHVKLILRHKAIPTVDLEISSCCAYPPPDYQVYGSRGGIVAYGAEVKWKYVDPRSMPPRELTLTPLVNEKGLPTYCSEQLKWKEKTWRFKGDNLFAEGRRAYYDMLYKVLCGKGEMEITRDELRLQVYVIEESLRQNPSSVMGEADLPERNA